MEEAKSRRREVAKSEGRKIAIRLDTEVKAAYRNNNSLAIEKWEEVLKILPDNAVVKKKIAVAEGEKSRQTAEP